MIKKCKGIKTTTVINGKVPYIVYDSIEETRIAHSGFSTKLGGVSKGQFESMNFSVLMGDTKENVDKNFEIFGKEAGFDNLVLSQQTHTTNIRKVSKDDIGKGIYKEFDYFDIDGLVTNIKGITLTTFYADCVPLYFVDIKNKAIGLSHSGWRGTVNKMAKQTLLEMDKEYGTNPSDVIVSIGPSICVNCYEVSKDVAMEFVKVFDEEVVPYKNDVKEQDMNHILYSKEDEKYMLNLWAANYKILIEAGVDESNISIPDICTCCNSEYLFSHRATHGKRGNLGAFLMMR